MPDYGQDHVATVITEAKAPTLDLRLTVPPGAALAETITTFDPRSSTRSSLLSALAGNAATSSARYEPGALLGKGGMGVVVLAMDRDLARPVAIKQLRADVPTGDLVERFLKEAQVTAQLEHPGIVPVHDVGADEKGRFYYVMRLVKGDRTLRRIIDLLREGDDETHRNYTFERRVRIVQQVALILDYAHARGVVHRDVKPENIMVGQYGEVYLLDWGLAKVVGEGRDTIELTAPGSGTETRAGRLVGTPFYMAPEQARGEETSPRSNVYGLSAVLYELLTLEHYLGEPDCMAELIQKVQTEAPRPAWTVLANEKNGRVPRALSVICDGGLAKLPRDRYPTAAAFEAALQGAQEGETPVLCPPTLLLWILNHWRRATIRRPLTTSLLTLVLPVLALVSALVVLAVRALR